MLSRGRLLPTVNAEFVLNSILGSKLPSDLLNALLLVPRRHGAKELDPVFPDVHSHQQLQ